VTKLTMCDIYGLGEEYTDVTLVVMHGLPRCTVNTVWPWQ